MIVFDVRSAREYVAGHVPGARHMPFWKLFWRTPGLPDTREAPIMVYCGHGPRAWMAKGLLRARGFRRVRLMAGHMRRWRREGNRAERIP